MLNRLEMKSFCVWQLHCMPISVSTKNRQHMKEGLMKERKGKNSGYVGEGENKIIYLKNII